MDLEDQFSNTCKVKFFCAPPRTPNPRCVSTDLAILPYFNGGCEDVLRTLIGLTGTTVDNAERGHVMFQTSGKIQLFACSVNV